MLIDTLEDAFRRRYPGFRPRLGGQTFQAAGVVAMHPVTQGLAIHRAGLCRFPTRATLQHQRNRQYPARHFGVLCSRRYLAQMGG